MKVTHIQYTARPPVKRSGDFIRLKVKAVLPSSIRESYTAAPHKKAGKKRLRPQLVFLRSEQLIRDA